MPIWMPILMIGTFFVVFIPMIFLSAYMRQKRQQEANLAQANMQAGFAMQLQQPPPQPFMMQQQYDYYPGQPAMLTPVQHAMYLNLLKLLDYFLVNIGLKNTSLFIHSAIAFINF